MKSLEIKQTIANLADMAESRIATQDGEVDLVSACLLMATAVYEVAQQYAEGKELMAEQVGKVVAAPAPAPKKKPVPRIVTRPAETPAAPSSEPQPARREFRPVPVGAKRKAAMPNLKPAGAAPETAE